LDISRHYQAALLEDPTTRLLIHWLPGVSADQLDADLQALGNKSVARWLAQQLPERLAQALCHHVGLIEGQPLTRPQRRALVEAITQMPLPITGNRGYTYAEVTAGGIPLSQIRLETMESRVCAGLHLCGEICDVDGRIGGYNFQWAWSSGYVAGISAAH
jgi:predicted Rossmann fold flavoprotein